MKPLAGVRIAGVAALVPLVLIGGFLLLGGQQATPGVSVLSSAAVPAGTPLRDGFVVPIGSVLVGDVYLTSGLVEPGGEVSVGGIDTSTVDRKPTLPASEWTAVLAAATDIVPVFNDLARQAEALGFPLQTGADQKSPCEAIFDPRDETGPHPLDKLTAGQKPVGVTCSGSFLIDKFDGNSAKLSSTQVRFFARSGVDAEGKPTQSHLQISFSRTGDGTGSPSESDYPMDIGRLPTSGPPILVVPPPLPRAGAPVGPISGGGDLDLTIPAGSQAATAAITGECPGYIRVLTATDGYAALEDLIRQATDAGFVEPGNPPTSTTDAQGTVQYWGAYSPDDGGSIGLWAVDRPAGGHPDSVLVKYCIS